MATYSPKQYCVIDSRVCICVCILTRYCTVCMRVWMCCSAPGLWPALRILTCTRCYRKTRRSPRSLGSLARSKPCRSLLTVMVSSSSFPTISSSTQNISQIEMITGTEKYLYFYWLPVETHTGVLKALKTYFPNQSLLLVAGFSMHMLFICYFMLNYAIYMLNYIHYTALNKYILYRLHKQVQVIKSFMQYFDTVLYD